MLWSDYATTFYIFDGVAGLLVLILLVFTFVGGKSKSSAAEVAPPAAGPSPTPAAPAPTPPAAPENTLQDLNNDGKIDVQDILLALEEYRKNQQKKEEE